MHIIEDVKKNATKDEKKRIVLSIVSLGISIITLIVAIIALMQ